MWLFAGMSANVAGLVLHYEECASKSGQRNKSGASSSQLSQIEALNRFESLTSVKSTVAKRTFVGSWNLRLVYDVRGGLRRLITALRRCVSHGWLHDVGLWKRGVRREAPALREGGNDRSVC